MYNIFELIINWKKLILYSHYFQNQHGPNENAAKQYDG